MKHKYLLQLEDRMLAPSFSTNRTGERWRENAQVPNKKMSGRPPSGSEEAQTCPLVPRINQHRQNVYIFFTAQV
jgi:hypothetical protein